MKLDEHNKLNTIDTGIPWYRPEEYQKCRKLFVDGDILQETYKSWLAAAERLEKQLKKNGVMVFRIPLDPNAFPAWCLAKGMKLDAQARTAFATEGARDVYDKANYDFNL